MGCIRYGLIWLVAACASAQVKFEVASIKPAPDVNAVLSAGGVPHLGMKMDGAMVDIGGMSVKRLILVAYKLKGYQVTGPDWLDAARFDILAKIPAGANKEQVPEMLQALLAERFKVTVHRETKDQPVFALVVGKDGTKLKPPLPDETPAAADARDSGFVKAGGRGGDTLSGSVTGPYGRTNIKVTNGVLHMEYGRMTLTGLADSLVGYLNRPVIDMTNVKGTFQITMDFSLADTLAAAKATEAGGTLAEAQTQASDPTGTSVFASVQRLGLKLEPRKTPIEVLVVDRAEKSPTEN